MHLDNLGSVEATTTADQSVETRYRTDAWGSLESGSAADNPFDWGGGLGYWHDADLSLQYVRARWYDPSTGEWLSVDPVEGQPRYLYVGQAPTWRTDASGLPARRRAPLEVFTDPSGFIGG